MAKKSKASKLLKGNETPTAEETTKDVQDVQKLEGREFDLNDAKGYTEPDKYKSRIGRVRYTTMMDETIKDNLHQVARSRGVSVADILETCIIAYFGEAVKEPLD